jgi:hypothetical protein
MVDPIADTNTAVIFINQLRSKMTGYGGSTTSGGRALPYAASVRIDLKTVPERVEDSDKNQVGLKVKANIVKNKVAAPYKSVEYYVMNGRGIDNEMTLLEYGKRYKLVSMAGGGYYYWIDPATGERSEKPFAQGLEKAATVLRETDLGETVKKAIEAEYNRRSKDNGND